MFRLTVEDVFSISGRGVVATGRVEEGSIGVGAEVQINAARRVRVEGIEAFRKKLDVANAGDNVGLLFKGLEREDLKRGDVITGEAAAGFTAPPPPALADGLDQANEALGRKPKRRYPWQR